VPSSDSPPPGIIMCAFHYELTQLLESHSAQERDRNDQTRRLRYTFPTIAIDEGLDHDSIEAIWRTHAIRNGDKMHRVAAEIFDELALRSTLPEEGGPESNAPLKSYSYVRPRSTENGRLEVANHP
jgi:hypothetical protein